MYGIVFIMVCLLPIAYSCSPWFVYCLLVVFVLVCLMPIFILVWFSPHTCETNFVFVFAQAFFILFHPDFFNFPHGPSNLKRTRHSLPPLRSQMHPCALPPDSARFRPIPHWAAPLCTRYRPLAFPCSPLRSLAGGAPMLLFLLSSYVFAPMLHLCSHAASLLPFCFFAPILFLCSHSTSLLPCCIFSSKQLLCSHAASLLTCCFFTHMLLLF